MIFHFTTQQTLYKLYGFKVVHESLAYTYKCKTDRYQPWAFLRNHYLYSIQLIVIMPNYCCTTKSCICVLKYNHIIYNVYGHFLKIIIYIHSILPEVTMSIFLMTNLMTNGGMQNKFVGIQMLKIKWTLCTGTCMNILEWHLIGYNIYLMSHIRVHVHVCTCTMFIHVCCTHMTNNLYQGIREAEVMRLWMSTGTYINKGINGMLLSPIPYQILQCEQKMYSVHLQCTFKSHKNMNLNKFEIVKFFNADDREHSTCTSSPLPPPTKINPWEQWISFEY